MELSFVDLLLFLLVLSFSTVVVLAKDTLVSAFALLLTFVALAGIFFQVGALFLSVIQVMVYAGAVAILFIFVLMLMNLSDIKNYIPHYNYRKWFSFVGVICLGFLIFDFILAQSNLHQDQIAKTSLIVLFESLFVRFMAAFELATVLLLAVVVSVVFLSKNQENLSKKE